MPSALSRASCRYLIASALVMTACGTVDPRAAAVAGDPSPATPTAGLTSPPAASTTSAPGEPHVLLLKPTGLIELRPSETREILARVADENGRVIPDAVITWELVTRSGSAPFGTVTPGPSGTNGTSFIFTAGATTGASGTLVLRYRHPTDILRAFSDNLKVRVRSMVPSTIRVEPSSAAIRPGSLEPFAAIVADTDGRLLCAEVSWHVDPASAGTMLANGVFRAAQAPGRAKLTATVAVPGAAPLTAATTVEIRPDAPPPPSPTVPRAVAPGSRPAAAAPALTTLPPPTPTGPRGTIDPRPVVRPDATHIDLATGQYLWINVYFQEGGRHVSDVETTWTVCPSALGEFRLNGITAEARGGGAIEATFWTGIESHRTIVLRVR